MNVKSRHVVAALWAAIIVPGLLTTPVNAAAYSWNSAGGGNWTDTSATGWNSGGAYPSVAGDTATISQNITSDATITLDANVALGSLTLTDATSANYNWIIRSSDASANKLTFDNGASAATLSTTSSSTAGSHEIAAPVILNSNLTVSVTGSGANKQLTLSGPLSGSGGLTVAGTSTGVLTLASANTYTGTTTLSAGSGVLRLANADALAGSALALAGGTLQLRSDTEGTLFTTQGTTVQANVTVNVDQLTAAGGTGKTLRLGPVAVGDVAANFYATGANGYALSVGDITLNSTSGKKFSVFANGANVSLANVTSLAPAGITDTFQLDGTGSGGSVGVVNGVISNGGAGGKLALIKTNTSTWTLSGANTFTGTTTISNGVLKLANASALQYSALGISAANGLAFADGIGTFTLGSLSGVGSFSLASTSGDAITLRIGNDNAANYTAYSGVMSGSGGITKIGSAQILIGGANSNTYAGDTTVEAGALKLAASNALPVATSLVANGGYMDLNGYSQTVGQLRGASTGIVRNNAVNSTSTLTVTGSSQYDGVIANGQSSDRVMALAKSVGGTLTLTGANTYSGGTTVSGGTLLVNNASGSGLGTGNVTVSGTGTLGGSGRIAMAAGNKLSIASGGTLSPGNSPGILTIVGTQSGTPTAGNATLNFASGSTFAVQLNGLTAGTDCDSIALTGNADLGNATLGVDMGMTLGAGQVFTIINNDQADAVLNTFAGLAQDATIPGIASNGYGLKISYTGEGGAITGGNDVVLYSVAIPEPTAMAVLSLGFAGLLSIRPRRR